MNANELIDILKPGNSEVFRLGTVTEVLSGKAMVLFDGETEPSNKCWAKLSSYTPVANDRIMLARISGTYVILGKINF